MENCFPASEGAQVLACRSAIGEAEARTESRRFAEEMMVSIVCEMRMKEEVDDEPVLIGQESITPEVVSFGDPVDNTSEYWYVRCVLSTLGRHEQAGNPVVLHVREPTTSWTFARAYLPHSSVREQVRRRGSSPRDVHGFPPGIPSASLPRAPS
jgi:hypothetical protein